MGYRQIKKAGQDYLQAEDSYMQSIKWYRQKRLEAIAQDDEFLADMYEVSIHQLNQKRTENADRFLTILREQS